MKPGIVPPEFQAYLTDGEDSRRVGDYHFKNELTEEDAAKVFEHARKFLELAERLIGPIP